MKKEFKIEAIPVSSLKRFNPKEFWVRPGRDHGFEWQERHSISKELFEQCKQAASLVADICIVKLSDNIGEFVLGESCSKGCSSKFILFNAAACGREAAELRAVTPNTGKGALTRYWYDQFFCYRKGGLG